MRQFEKKVIDRMLEAGAIEPTNTKWASLIKMVSKKDVFLCLCVDYRELNSVTIMDSYPISRIDEYIDSLGDGTIFTTLDAN